MTSPLVRSRRRRRGVVLCRGTVAALCERLRGHDEAMLAGAVASAADAWFRVVGTAGLQTAETERLADLLVSAGSVLVQDDEPALGHWAQAAAAAITALALAEQEATATVVLRVLLLRGCVVGVSLRAKLRCRS
jgi:hypothetical protein